MGSFLRVTSSKNSLIILSFLLYEWQFLLGLYSLTQTDLAMKN